MSQSLLGQPLMGQYIIKGNHKELAKVHLLPNIITNKDVRDYILRMYAKLLGEEYDIIIASLLEMFKGQNNLFTECNELCNFTAWPKLIGFDDIYCICWLDKMLDNIDLVFKFNSGTIIDPTFLILMLQHDHKIIYEGRSGAYTHYRVKNMIGYCGMMHNVQIKCRCVMLTIPSFFKLLCWSIIDRVKNKHYDTYQFIVSPLGQPSRVTECS